jgi:hypothetical protein
VESGTCIEIPVTGTVLHSNTSADVGEWHAAATRASAVKARESNRVSRRVRFALARWMGWRAERAAHLRAHRSAKLQPAGKDAHTSHDVGE